MYIISWAVWQILWIYILYVVSSINFRHVRLLLKTQTYLMGIHCTPITIPIKRTTRVLIPKGGQLTGKTWTIYLLFLYLRQKKVQCLKPVCLSTHDSNWLYTSKSSNVDRVFGLVSHFKEWPIVSKLRWSCVDEIFSMDHVKKK